jgi:hypothetical protein
MHGLKPGGLARIDCGADADLASWWFAQHLRQRVHRDGHTRAVKGDNTRERCL